MQYIKEFSEGFEPWSGAVDVYNRIVDERGIGALERVLEDIFCDETPTDGAINDLLWFEADTVYKALGMKPDDTNTHTLAEIVEEWEDGNPEFTGARGEIMDCDTIRIYYTDPEDTESGEQYDELGAEDIANLFGDDCGEIDEDAQTVETWRD